MSAVVKSPPPPLDTVFVYGTLKKYNHNHRLLEGATYLRDAEVTGILLHLGGFPGLLECTEGGQKVHGELFRVKDADQWDALDALEGHPNHYKRTLVQTSNGWAYTYHYQRYNSNQSKYQIILNGMWQHMAPSLPFLGFRKTMSGLAKVSGVIHLTDELSGFAGLVNLYTGAILTSNGKDDLRPRYVYNNTLNQWELAPMRNGAVYIPPTRRLHIPPPAVDATKIPVVIKTETTVKASVYVDDTDPGEEDIGAVGNG